MRWKLKKTKGFIYKDDWWIVEQYITKTVASHCLFNIIKKISWKAPDYLSPLTEMLAPIEIRDQSEHNKIKTTIYTTIYLFQKW